MPTARLDIGLLLQHAVKAQHCHLVDASKETQPTCICITSWMEVHKQALLHL